MIRTRAVTETAKSKRILSIVLRFLPWVEVEFLYDKNGVLGRKCNPLVRLIRHFQTGEVNPQQSSFQR